MSENRKLISLWGNYEKRQAFLEAYREWSLWLTTPELELTYYRYQLPDGSTIIAMEHRQRIYNWKNHVHEWENDVSYYILMPGEPFYPGSSSASLANSVLKDAKGALQKKTVGGE